LEKALILFAGVAAPLLAFTLPPGATALNQIVALLGWGAVTLCAWYRVGRGTPAVFLHLAASLVTVGIALCVAQGRVPMQLGLPPLLLLLAAVAAAMQSERARSLGATAVFVAFAVLGAAHSLIAFVQVFYPDVADGALIASSALGGRAVGNVRQPNHLSSFALWSAVAVVPLVTQVAGKRRGALVALYVASIITIELSASRTGVVGLAIAATWGLADRKLPSVLRNMLGGGVAIYAVGWWGISWWAEQRHLVFGAAKRIEESDLSGSRWAIWSNTLELIKANPWSGVGFGEFNFAWTLSPFPNRPTAFFDHSHNIVLQLLVELGIPLGGLIVVLLAVALWQAFRRAWSVEGERGVGYRAAFIMVLMIAIHSMLEYPLWYAYFLLPTAWLWGYCLGATNDTAEANTGNPSLVSRAFPVVAGSLMIAGSAVAFQQYMTVSRIFEPRGDTRPLEVRIAEGQRSIFFGHHAHYAAATTADRPSEAWDSFRVATHFLLDTRLMIAWANAFAERGDLDRARHLAQRLREFRRPESAEYFAPCDQPEAGQPRPYQCDPPSRVVDWREFRDPALWATPSPGAEAR